MTLEPDPQETIFERIKSAIASASSITNFSPNSPEKAISDDAFAAEMRERQHEALAVQLSARVDYAGKTITEEDLEDLDVDPDVVDLDLLNSFIQESDLDEFAKRNGVTRDPGSFAEGTVTFQTTGDSVVIPDGTTVGTQPDEDGDYLAFVTTQEVSPDTGTTQVDAPVQAVNRGSAWNVGSGTITYVPNPPPGVEGDPPVNNTNATTGGEDEETTPELRERTKRALVETSGGGTKGGLEGGLVSRFTGLDSNDVIVDEFPKSDPVYGDVIIDGGPTDADAQDAIDDLRPVAVSHNLVRPTAITVDVTVEVEGTDVDTAEVETDINDYLTTLGLGEDVVRDKLIATTMTADLDVENITSLTVTIVDEPHVYDSDNSGGNAANHPLYHLDKGDSMAPDSSTNGNGIVEVTGTLNGASNTFVEGTDYDEGDVGNDGTLDAIDWGLAGDNPDEDSTFNVDYDIEDDIPVGDREKAEPGAVSVTVV